MTAREIMALPNCPIKYVSGGRSMTSVAIDMKATEERAIQWRLDEIKRLHAEKKALLDAHGVFGGGPGINAQHQAINEQLEQLGIY